MTLSEYQIDIVWSYNNVDCTICKWNVNNDQNGWKEFGSIAKKNPTSDIRPPTGQKYGIIWTKNYPRNKWYH